MITRSYVDWAALYLEERRSLGFGLAIAGNRLLAFARFADAQRHRKVLTIKLMVAWACAVTRTSAVTYGRRLEIVRPFAKWLQQHDARTEVPPVRYFGSAHRRLQPHIYTHRDLMALLREANGLSPRGGLRPASVATLLGLLASTGMRVSEAIALRNDDVRLDDALLVVRLTKFKKSRLVPIHPTVVRELRRYVALRDRLVPRFAAAAFFVIDGGAHLTYSKVRTAFRRLRLQMGWENASGRRPRIHDLRHTFACRRLLRWHKEQVDVDSRILDLSTYLGHAKASDTYWYLCGFPELMALASRRFEEFSAGENQP